MTIADLVLGNELLHLRLVQVNYADIGCPKVQAYVDNFANIPEINAMI